MKISFYLQLLKCQNSYTEKYGDEFHKISLSNDTVARRIAENSDDQLQQLITRLKKSQKFAIQLDETTDVSKNAQLLLYVRHVREENVEEELLFCRSLKCHTKGEDIFKVDEFLRLQVYNGKIALEFVQTAQGQ